MVFIDQAKTASVVHASLKLMEVPDRKPDFIDKKTNMSRWNFPDGGYCVEVGNQFVSEKIWFNSNHQRHRLDGPAYCHVSKVEWYVNGKLIFEGMPHNKFFDRNFDYMRSDLIQYIEQMEAERKMNLAMKNLRSPILDSIKALGITKTNEIIETIIKEKVVSDVHDG